MLDDVAAVEINVFHQRSTIVAIKYHVFVFSRRTAPLHHNANRVRRTDRRMRNVRRNKEGFAFANEMVDDTVALADAHFNVAFQLIKILFRVDQMKIVPRVRTFDHHHKKIAPIVEITIADRRFEFFAILFDPIFQIDRRLNGASCVFFGR